MATSRTRTGTRKLSEVARHVIQPEGIVSTGYPAVQAKCRDMGIVHDDWQQGLGRLILGKRKDGKYAATVGGVVLSIPRQVGKTFTVGSILFALCILFPGLMVLWTAHRTRTSNETFRSMQGMARRKKIAAHVAYVRATNGEQEIGFRNGSRILFGAREQGFGRGFAQVDVEVFDEAQILSERALEDMVAATNQARHPAGALLFYMGTPPRDSDPGEVFRSKRAKALSGKAKDMVYVELSADPDADPDDRKQWARANPSFPTRTPPESMLRLRENVGSDESFLREGLGVWAEKPKGGGAFDLDAWAGAADPDAERGASPVFGVDVGEDRLAHIAVAWRRDDGLVQAMLADSGLSPLRAPERLQQLREAWLAPIVLGGTSVSMEDSVEGTSIASGVDFADACGSFADLLAANMLRHGNQAELNAAVRDATWRRAGASGARSIQLAGSPTVGPLAAVIRALHGLNAGLCARTPVFALT